MKKLIVSIFFAAIAGSINAQVRSSVGFNTGWKFYLGNDSTAKELTYDDSKWRKLSLPHDWSIESDFIKDAPATPEGGSLPGGIGWYRKEFVLSATAKDKIISIEFGGVYQNSEVWINRHYLGKRPNGYISFSYELTNYLLQAPQKNIIAVKVDNSQQPNSRWYSGSGIYRDVKLISHRDIFIEENGLFITTKSTNEKKAVLELTTVLNTRLTANQPIRILASVLNNKGVVVKQANPVSMNLYFNGGALVKKIELDNPVFWSVSNPNLYTIKVQIEKAGKIVDEISTPFGIRTIHFDKDKGFFLNDKALKIQGVCMHHDLGAIGAAFNIAAATRQLKILKEMGCNAIRFAHNPPATEMLDLCDQMGFLVIDEAFDMWYKKKNKYDYHKDFKEWHKQDLEDQIKRDRNHPSIIMWSVGNEIREQFDSTGITITRELVDIVKALDPTRPVTSAMTETKPKYNFIAKSNALDVFGFNYREYDYDSLPYRFPNQKFIASESASSIATRGVYYFPSDSIRTWPIDYKHQPDFDGGNADFTGPAFDNTKAYWGNTHENSWLAVKRNPHMAGTFIWSGFDYIGEPLPYPKFPARSSYFGVIDLAGFPKDVYYMYQSEWTKKNVLHLFPHWNWAKGQMVDVWAYYNNADEVELFVNGKSAGNRTKPDTVFHVIWRVPFEAGTIKAVSKKNGKIVATREIKTAGDAYRIELKADKQTARANGRDMVFITARIVDKAGNTVPEADNLMEFSITGNGIIAGTDNGYQADTVSLKSKKRKAWKGLALAMVQATEKKGNSTVTASAPGLKLGVINLTFSQ